MPERDAEFFEVLISQVRQDWCVDVILGKALGILGHAEFFEPVSDLLHRGPAGLQQGRKLILFANWC
jgi:hypothetical protein